MFKDRGNVEGWVAYHGYVATDPETDIMTPSTNAAAYDAAYFNDTAPTTAVFSVGTDGVNNGSSKTYVAYRWAGVEGYSKFGSYEGNGNADGPFVWCGFRPSWVMTKSIDSTGEWFTYTSDIVGYNPNSIPLDPSTPAAETSGRPIDFLSNGFKHRHNDDPNVAETYLFVAFAEFPFGGDGVSQGRAR